MSATLIVIAKEPVPGRTKTRLCPPCTPTDAARIAEAALVDTLTAVARANVPRRVLALDGTPGAWLPEGFDVIAQRGNGLDERLASAFEDTGNAALLIGMDTPQVTSALLEAAIDELFRPEVDAVLGLASDGGWWALGLRDPDRRVFEGVPMSTSHTGEDQRRRLEELGLGYAMLPELRDIDRFEDAIAVAETIPGTRLHATLDELLRTGEGEYATWAARTTLGGA